MRDTVQRLALPWDELFSALESAASDKVALAGDRARHRKAGTVTISGDGKDYLAALSYVLNLSRTEGLERVQLVRHEQKTEDPKRGELRGVAPRGARNEAHRRAHRSRRRRRRSRCSPRPLAFSNFVVQAAGGSAAVADCWRRIQPQGRQAQSGAKVAAVYEYLKKDGDTTDWLAKLHGIGTRDRRRSCSRRATARSRPRAASCATRSCCRCPAATRRSATSSSARLAEIPVLSVDQVTLKREDEERRQHAGGDAPHPAHGEIMKLNLQRALEEERGDHRRRGDRGRRRGGGPRKALRWKSFRNEQNRSRTTASTSASCAGARGRLPQNDPFAQRLRSSRNRPRRSRTPRPDKPAAPPLPFRYFGKLTENGKTEVLVMRGDELITIAAGPEDRRLPRRPDRRLEHQLHLPADEDASRPWISNEKTPHSSSARWCCSAAPARKRSSDGQGMIEAGNDEQGLAQPRRGDARPTRTTSRSATTICAHKAVAVQRYLQTGENARAAGDLDQAEAAYQRALRFDPANANAQGRPRGRGARPRQRRRCVKEADEALKGGNGRAALEKAQAGPEPRTRRSATRAPSCARSRSRRSRPRRMPPAARRGAEERRSPSSCATRRCAPCSS